MESNEAMTTATGDRCFDILLDEPFLIEVEKIYVEVNRGVNGASRWKQTIPANYQLDVEIKCEDLEDSEQFLDLLYEDSSKADHSFGGDEPILRATWPHLPNVPSPGTLLPLQHGRRDDAFKFQHGLELSIGWSKRSDPPLVAYAKAKRSACLLEQEQEQEQRQQLPTPSASDGSDKTTKQHVITYVWSDERYIVMENLKCPLCANEETVRGRYEYPSFDRLHWHLLTWHEHFQPQIEDEERPGSTAVHKAVHLWLSEKMAERDGMPAKKSDEEVWIAPTRPFDQKAYVNGEDTWTGHPMLKPQGRRGTKSMRTLAAAKRNLANGLAESRPVPVKAKKPIAKIKDIAPAPKRRWPVPKVPGVRFYRTISKRPFEEGEEVSESDEDVDESWLRDRLRDDMASLKLSKGSEAFLQDWNSVANKEHFSADVLIREGVVRFIRKFHARLRDGEYRGEFLRFLTRLKTHGVIDAEVFDYCCEQAQRAVDESDASSDHSSRALGSRSTNGDSAGGAGYVGRTCVCGKPVISARGAIVCHDTVSLSLPPCPLPCNVVALFPGMIANFASIALLSSLLPHAVRRATESS